VKNTSATMALDAEATKVVSAAQAQLTSLPTERKLRLSDALQNQFEFAPSPAGKPASFNELVTLDPRKLTLGEKNDLLSHIERTQQLVDPTLVPSAASGGDVEAILSAFQSSSPLTSLESQRARQSLKTLPTAAKSVGRILWSNPTDGNWHFEGTVFVTKTNVVATACHVIGELTDVSAGQLVLRKDRIAVVDFSEVALPKAGPLPAAMHTYPVSKILATGSGQGCDVALLQISGAESVPSLRLSTATSPPKRVVVLGYPQLADLSPLVCKSAVDPTVLYFCQFRAAHADAAKVSSPGNFSSSSSHDGLGVFTYSANTRGGQSGSPVLDLETLQVSGVHYCCTGSTDVPYSLGCATWHPQNLKWNEAIDSATILADKALKNYFDIP
jgi:hypothetical protein